MAQNFESSNLKMTIQEEQPRYLHRPSTPSLTFVPSPTPSPSYSSSSSHTSSESTVLTGKQRRELQKLERRNTRRNNGIAKPKEKLERMIEDEEVRICFGEDSDEEEFSIEGGMDIYENTSDEKPALRKRSDRSVKWAVDLVDYIPAR